MHQQGHTHLFIPQQEEEEDDFSSCCYSNLKFA